MYECVACKRSSVVLVSDLSCWSVDMWKAAGHDRQMKH